MGKTANCKLKKKVVFISRMQATSLSVTKENEFGSSLGATKDFILTPLSNMNELHNILADTNGHFFLH